MAAASVAPDPPGPADAAESSGAPRRGRPRSVEADRRILDATLELAREIGISAMSMDDVAQRAAASKATIYRRWPSKEALVLDALRHAIQPFDDLDTGSLRGDVEAYLRALTDKMKRGRSTDLLPHLIEAAVHDETLRGSLDEYVQHRRRPLLAIYRRGRGRGELPADADVELLVDLTIGPLVYRRLLSHAPLDRKFISGLVDHILRIGT